MAKISIDGDDFVQALQSNSMDEGEFYLDMETGAVVMVYDGMIDGVTVEEDEDIDEIVQSRPYLQIQTLQSYEAFEILKDFTASLPDGEAKRRLEDTFDGRKAFRRFKDCLFDHPDIRTDFFQFEEDAYRQIARDWLEEHEIEADIRFGPIPSSSNTDGR